METTLFKILKKVFSILEHFCILSCYNKHQCILLEYRHNRNFWNFLTQIPNIILFWTMTDLGKHFNRGTLIWFYVNYFKVGFMFPVIILIFLLQLSSCYEDQLSCPCRKNIATTKIHWGRGVVRVMCRVTNKKIQKKNFRPKCKNVVSSNYTNTSTSFFSMSSTFLKAYCKKDFLWFSFLPLFIKAKCVTYKTCLQYV